jgi:tetrahydromethanopterin S-methyltransferase subunit G
MKCILELLVELEVVYNKTNSRMEKLENVVDALKTEKHYFVQANRKMAKDISKMYFKYIFFFVFINYN